MEPMPIFNVADWIAVACFAVNWAGYAWLVDVSPWRERTLTAAMNEQRRRWMEAMLIRENRILDTQVIGGLQSGAAFFASTSLLAIGAAFALLTTSEQVLDVVDDLPFSMSASRVAWEIKALGLMAIYAYAFFKFGWSVRLFNYASILMGATPPASERDTEKARLAIERAVHMNVVRGGILRAASGLLLFRRFLGWFASAWLFSPYHAGRGVRPVPPAVSRFRR
jgi:uncharacterized membrane protein